MGVDDHDDDAVTVVVVGGVVIVVDAAVGVDDHDDNAIIVVVDDDDDEDVVWCACCGDAGRGAVGARERGSSLPAAGAGVRGRRHRRRRVDEVPQARLPTGKCITGMCAAPHQATLLL